jgi:hypothetical protein
MPHKSFRSSVAKGEVQVRKQMNSRLEMSSTSGKLANMGSRAATPHVLSFKHRRTPLNKDSLRPFATDKEELRDLAIIVRSEPLLEKTVGKTERRHQQSPRDDTA